MIGWFLLLCAWQVSPEVPAGEQGRERIRRLIERIIESGRVVEIAEPLEERTEPPQRIAPGDPPLLAFRYLEGKERARFGQLDLMLDDAGH